MFDRLQEINSSYTARLIFNFRPDTNRVDSEVALERLCKQLDESEQFNYTRCVQKPDLNFYVIYADTNLDNPEKLKEQLDSLSEYSSLVLMAKIHRAALTRDTCFRHHLTVSFEASKDQILPMIQLMAQAAMEEGSIWVSLDQTRDTKSCNFQLHWQDHCHYTNWVERADVQQGLESIRNITSKRELVNQSKRATFIYPRESNGISKQATFIYPGSNSLFQRESGSNPNLHLS